MKKSDDRHDHLRTATLLTSKLHIFLIALYTVQTIIFHASQVITPQVVMWRWQASGALLVIVVAAWLAAKNRHISINTYNLIIWLVILADLAFAAFNVYIQRGYASKAVALFIIPIVVASVLANRAALFATALLAIAIYTTTVISYFVLNFNEGYMSEMYGEIILYSGVFLLTAGLLWSATHKR